MPLVIVTGHHAHHDLPREGGGAIAVQDQFPIVPPVREHDVRPDADPSGILPDRHRVAAIGDVSLWVFQVGVPEKSCDREEEEITLLVLGDKCMIESCITCLNMGLYYERGGANP